MTLGGVLPALLTDQSTFKKLTFCCVLHKDVLSMTRQSKSMDLLWFTKNTNIHFYAWVVFSMESGVQLLSLVILVVLQFAVILTDVLFSIVTSFGGNDEKCLKNQDQDSCISSIHTKVSFFHDWIIKHAGKQDSSTFHMPYLHGQLVSKGTYVHQVHIISATGKPCGGTLIKKYVVMITAASCVANANGSLHSELKVHYGINDLTVREMTPKLLKLPMEPYSKDLKWLGIM